MEVPTRTFYSLKNDLLILEVNHKLVEQHVLEVGRRKLEKGYLKQILCITFVYKVLIFYKKTVLKYLFFQTKQRLKSLM